MKPGRLSKLLRRSPPVAADVSAALDELSRVAKDRSFLSRHTAVLAEIFPVMFAKADTSVLVNPVDESRARAKLEAGIPILRGESVCPDVAEFEKRWRAISAKLRLETLSVQQTRMSEAPAEPEASAKATRREPRRTTSDQPQLGRLLGREGWSCEALIRDVLSGDIDKILTQAEADGVAVELLKTVLRLTLFPVLSRLRIQQQAVLQQSRWQAGCCPVCGSAPLLAEFRGLEQIRFLRCGLCAADWEFPRLQCPHCGNRDHRQLGYFHVEHEQDKFRAATCDVCHGYVKTASTLAALDGPQLLVMDVATMHLDLAAIERGFHSH